ncbi:hypothetical protein L0F63_007507 [Massospora cicadina]|nr:hypothetical protein L0F63_007507 [Massospora cicadina]
MSTFDSSDSDAAFDGNVVKYVCYETNCREDFHEEILGKNNGPGSPKCSTEITIPDNLPDGPVTLQWTWFGGGVFFADQKAAFANYVSCSDMILEGGNPYQPNRIPPEFQGGDAVTQDKGQMDVVTVIRNSAPRLNGLLQTLPSPVATHLPISAKP